MRERRAAECEQSRLLFVPALVMSDQLEISNLVSLARTAVGRFSASRKSGVDDAIPRFLERTTLLPERRTLNLRNANACLPLVALPTAVLQRLLEHCDLRSRMAISEACHSLRATSLTMNRLWSQLRPRDASLLPTMHVLERSYPQPVHLRLEVDCGNGFDRWCRLISATLPQLEYLELTISAFYHSTAREPLQLHVAAMWQYLGRFLASPAPMLHTLYLTVHRDLDAEPFYLRDDILGGLPGRLRSCSLFDIRLPHSGSCTALSSVTTFDYSVCGAVIDERVIRRIFTMMPNLETFGLAAAIDAPLSPSPSYHSNLKRASIVVPRSADTSNLRGLFQHFHSVTLDITCVGSPSLDAGLEGYVDWQAPTCLFFTASFTVVAQLGADGHSAVRLARNYAWPPLSTSHSLVSLVVHEQVISYIGSPPTAPQISELCVVLASACEHEAPWFSSIFSDTGPLFDFSSLQVLRLCYLDARLMCNTHVCQYPDLDASRSLALSDVAEFIAGRVRFGSPRLARLVLEGVRNLVDVDLARAMSGL